MTVIICDSEEQLSKHLPHNLTKLCIADISAGIDTMNIYIQGTVSWVSQLATNEHRSLLKIVIQEGGNKVYVYLYEKYAESLQTVVSGDILVMSAVVIEPSPYLDMNTSPWKLIIDPSRSSANVWMVHKAHRKIPKNCQSVDTTSAVQPVSCQKTSVKGRTYQYTQLNKISVGQTVNIFGVVKYLKPASKTRGSDYSMFVTIVDDSSYIKLKCMIFARNKEMLPLISEPGEVVRFHRLKILEFGDDLQGQGNFQFGFSCLVFSGEVGSPLEPKSTSNTYTLSDNDKDRVCQLREWFNSQDILSQPVPLSTEKAVATASRQPLGKCAVGQFFDLICQVVCTCVLNKNSILLRIWDGTSPPFETKREDLSDDKYLDWLHIDESLSAQAGHLAVDIYVFDDHVNKATKVKPGDYIILKNLHAAVYSKQYTVPLDNQQVELIIHGGGASYGRDIKILDESSPEVVQLKKQLATQSSAKLLDSCNPTTSFQPVDCEDHQQRHASVCHSAGGFVSFENKCMLNTRTVLTSNHDQELSTVKEVREHSVPHKFRLLCHVIDCSPKPEAAQDIVKLYCKKCHFLTSLTVLGKSDDNLTPILYRKGQRLDLYSCPRCPGTASDKCLEYVFMLQLLLYDNTGWIVGGIWEEEAEKFFHGVKATDVLTDQNSFKFVQRSVCQLYQPLPQPSSSSRLSQKVDQFPIIECCVKSHATADGVCYNLFDTCLAAVES